MTQALRIVLDCKREMKSAIPAITRFIGHKLLARLREVHVGFSHSTYVVRGKTIDRFFADWSRTPDTLPAVQGSTQQALVTAIKSSPSDEVTVVITDWTGMGNLAHNAAKDPYHSHIPTDSLIFLVVTATDTSPEEIVDDYPVISESFAGRQVFTFCHKGENEKRTEEFLHDVGTSLGYDMGPPAAKPDKKPRARSTPVKAKQAKKVPVKHYQDVVTMLQQAYDAMPIQDAESTFIKCSIRPVDKQHFSFSVEQPGIFAGEVTVRRIHDETLKVSATITPCLSDLLNKESDKVLRALIKCNAPSTPFEAFGSVMDDLCGRTMHNVFDRRPLGRWHWAYPVTCGLLSYDIELPREWLELTE